MKKLLCLVLALVLAMSLFVSCGKKGGEDAQNPKTEESGTPVENNEATESGENTDAPEYDVPEPSSNKEVVTEEEAPDVYLVMGSEDNAASISYHLEGCKLLEGGESQKVAWEMVKTLGFRQCPECNPPQYEEYVE